MIRAQLVGGRHNGHTEVLDGIFAPPETLVMADCPHCKREHLIGADHLSDWRGDLAFYWLDREFWQRIGFRALHARYVHSDPTRELVLLQRSLSR